MVKACVWFGLIFSLCRHTYPLTQECVWASVLTITALGTIIRGAENLKGKEIKFAWGCLGNFCTFVSYPHWKHILPCSRVHPRNKYNIAIRSDPCFAAYLYFLRWWCSSYWPQFALHPFFLGLFRSPCPLSNRLVPEPTTKPPCIPLASEILF